MDRISRFLEDLGRLRREGGIGAAFKHIRERISYEAETFLYDLHTTGIPHELPEGMAIRTVRSAADPAVELLRQSGGDLNLHNFRRSAVAYVLSIGDEAVGHGWQFPNSPLARRLGPHTTYVGNIFVRPEFRGRGLNSHLLAFMAGSLPKGTRILMEVALTNVSSQRSLRKSGCALVGRLHIITVFSNIMRIRITPVPPASRGQAGP